MFDQNTTKTDKTKKAYLKKASQIIIQYNSYFGSTKNFNSEQQFYAWFVSRKREWTRNTWRQYKAAMVYGCEVWGFKNLGEMIKTTKNDACKDSEHRIPLRERLSSGTKKKSVSEKEMAKIIEVICTLPYSGYWERIGVEIFILSYFVGLRPCEYARSAGDIKVDDYGKEQAYIIVRNAKNTNGRSHGTFRHVAIGQFNKTIRQVIVNSIKMARKSTDAHGRKISSENYVRMASQAFSKLMRKVFPNKKAHITLYSARHQFCANMKRAGLSRAQVAALVGHGSDATASRHYGKRRCGRRSPIVPIPLESEVAKVQIKAKSFNKNNMNTKNTSSNATNKIVATKGFRMST